MEIKYQDMQEPPKQPPNGLRNFRGRVHDSGVDVINGISGIEHLSNSLVRKPLANFSPSAFIPTKAGGADYGFKGRNDDGIRNSIASRENTRGSSANKNNTTNPEVVYDPFFAN